MADDEQAVTNTPVEFIEAAGGLGCYLHQIIRAIPAELLGLQAEGWLKQRRTRNLARLEAETTRILQGMAKERLTEPSPSVVVPLLQECVDEGRESLQGFWVALLANVMVDGGRKVRREFFEVARRMEPADALLLDIAGMAGAASPADLSKIVRCRGVDRACFPPRSRSPSVPWSA